MNLINCFIEVFDSAMLWESFERSQLLKSCCACAQHLPFAEFNYTLVGTYLTVLKLNFEW